MQPDEYLDLPDVAGLRAHAEELEAQFLRLQNESAKLQKQAQALQVTEKSRDGLISATVGPRGDLIRLDIDPRIYQRPDARALADKITNTVKAAGTKAHDEIVELFSVVVPREQVVAHLSGDLDAVAEQLRRQMYGEG